MLQLDHNDNLADINCSTSQHGCAVAKGDEGFVLVATLVILILLVMLGISTTTTTNIELQIAGNDRVNKKTFYGADGSLDLGGRMVEENVACPTGFTVTSIGPVLIQNPSFWLKTPGDLLDSTLSRIDFDGVSDDGRDDRAFSFPVNANITSDVVIAGTTKFAAGSSIQMVAGYEGKGKGAAGGGSFIGYDIAAQANGVNSSRAELQINWDHVIGQEGVCNY